MEKSDYADVDRAFLSIGDAIYHHFLQHVCFYALFCRVCIGGLGIGLPCIFWHYAVVLSRVSIDDIRKTQGGYQACLANSIGAVFHLCTKSVECLSHLKRDAYQIPSRFVHGTLVGAAKDKILNPYFCKKLRQ